MITQPELREFFSYDPDTGEFTWLKAPASCVINRIGKRAGCFDRNGYVKMHIRGKAYYGHRLAWLYVYGKFPDRLIDHINGNPSDNRIENLREASYSLNGQNQRGPNIKNKTGFLGVHYSPARKAFVAEITINKKLMRIGAFETPELAHAAYVTAKRRLHAGCTI